MPTILIADDQADVLAALRLLFKNERYDIKLRQLPPRSWTLLINRSWMSSSLILITRATQRPAQKVWIYLRESRQ